MISEKDFCELMRSFNLSKEEEAKGYWSDEKLMKHYLKVHFEHHSGLCVPEGEEVTFDMFQAYIEKVCKVQGLNQGPVYKMYQQHIKDKKRIDFDQFYSMIFD